MFAANKGFVPCYNLSVGSFLLTRLLVPPVCRAEYQKLGFVMDIGSKIKRHEAMEAQLAEIEKDIRTLEAGDVVLVVPDNGSGY
jgi:hypothetical protein